jgi:hypothetical protein
MVKSPNKENKETFTSPIGALWEKSSAKCPKYMSGNITLDGGVEQKVVVFLNQYKRKGDWRPDWIISLIASKENGQEKHHK